MAGNEYNLGVPGYPDTINYKTESGEYICLYRTEDTALSGEYLFTYQDGTKYEEIEHCASCPDWARRFAQCSPTPTPTQTPTPTT